MTNEERQTLLRQAALAVGLNIRENNGRFFFDGPFDSSFEWRPHVNSEQCAEMNATLEHNTHWTDDSIGVGTLLLGGGGKWAKHNVTTADKVRAWMEASVRAAARVGEIKLSKQENEVIRAAMLDSVQVVHVGKMEQEQKK